MKLYNTIIILGEENLLDFIKIFFISLFTIFYNYKILDSREKKIKKFKIILLIAIVAAISIGFKIINSTEMSIIVLIMLLSIIFYVFKDKNYGHSILITLLSFAINYVFYLFSVSFAYFLLRFSNIENKYAILFLVILIYTAVCILISKIRRLKYGISFIKKYQDNEYFGVSILNVSLILIFIISIWGNLEIGTKKSVFLYIILYSIMIVITIQKSLQLYYKQKMLVKDLEETKEELEEKNNKIKELEKEIIKSGKRSHSISHRQKILEHKLEELSMKSEISEMDIKSRIEKIGKDIRKEPVIVLAKTGIVEIDDVLNYMKSECLKKKIDFQLQLSGNIYKMINNYVSKDELEILLADHIKNAIIAIEHSENINKSILVRLGRLDGTYGLYVYDSGIEFEIETFLKLGKKPATTHKDSGGTGMGFMNTFDTLRKHNASFIIEEYGKPVTDNFTKVLKFKFDNKNEFKICTYRKEEIEKQDKEKILRLENLMF